MCFADGQDERRIEELHKRRNFLAAYCKLIVYNVAPIRRAADVFKHYIKCYNDYGDIIKATLSKAREMNKLSCALSMQLAMQALYGDMLARHAAPHRQLPEFLELKELAKRFAVMFGLDAVKNREALTALHRAGIAFAAVDAPHRNLLFLEPLAEFSGKLLRQDKRTVLKFADSRFSSMQWGEEWAPLLAYRNSLLTDAPDERPPPARRHYTRRAREYTRTHTRTHTHMQWGEEWAPLLAYRNSLLTDAPDERPPPARRHYTRRAREYTRTHTRTHTHMQWGEEWAPLLAYRNSLLTDAPDERPPPARRHYTRRAREYTRTHTRTHTHMQWGEEWAPLLAYRNSLLTDAPDERPPPARRHYTRRAREYTRTHTRTHTHMQWGEEWAPLLAYRNSLLTDAPDERPPPARRHYTRRAREYTRHTHTHAHTHAVGRGVGAAARLPQLAADGRARRAPAARAPPLHAPRT
ncbi:unnamed protein product [Euphydryas editha]|uniref:Uncharacterized protein n=1 Tax=Euphydryas editha TaxID=104508 RepID=A0AAU9U195_EUPED|nr:unnamed protein product [Euphydryas editha]